MPFQHNDKSASLRILRHYIFHYRPSSTEEMPLLLPSNCRRWVRINKEVIHYLASQNDRLYSLSPRQFEEVVAELLVDMGADVELTPQTRDKGRDILASFKTPFGPMLGLVECKLYAATKRLGVGLLRDFLWVLDRQDEANFGIIATTGTFSDDAVNLQKEKAHWKLKLQDIDHIKQWLGQYGKWSEATSSGLWLPGDGGSHRHR